MGSELPDRPESSLSSPSRRRLRDIGVLCALLAALIAIFHFVPDGAERRARAAREVSASEPSARIASSLRVSSNEPMRAASSVLPAPARDDEIQLCGGEWLRLNADGRVNETEAVDFGRRSLEATKVPTLAAMESSRDERARAAAQFLQMADADAAVAQVHRDALARLAQGSTDPQVYAWAVQACGAAPSQGPCQLINAEQWARLDPSNGMPWLVIAANAEKRRDASTLDDAMFHIASAERQDTRWGMLTATVLDHVPSGEAFLPGALGLEIGAIGMEAVSVVPYQTVTRYCAVATVAEANRRQTCQAIAELFVARSTTLLDLGIGAGLGRRVLDWPEERIKSIEDELTALSGALPRDTEVAAEDASCNRFRRDIDHARDVGRYGELGALRRVMATSGKSVTQLADEFRKSMKENGEKRRPQDEVEAAASAASSTP